MKLSLHHRNDDLMTLLIHDSNDCPLILAVRKESLEPDGFLPESILQQELPGDLVLPLHPGHAHPPAQLHRHHGHTPRASSRGKEGREAQARADYPGYPSYRRTSITSTCPSTILLRLTCSALCFRWTTFSRLDTVGHREAGSIAITPTFLFCSLAIWPVHPPAPPPHLEQGGRPPRTYSPPPPWRTAAAPPSSSPRPC